MTSRKSKTILRVVGAVMALTLIVTCAMFSSIAKYESVGIGSDEVYTAKWSFNFSEAGKNESNDLVDTGSFDFDLFDETIASYDEDGNDVVKGLIAPGTHGSFAFEVKNNSEVTAEYDVELTATQDNLPLDDSSNEVAIPIEYSLIGTPEATDWTTEISDLDFENVRLEVGSEVAATTVYWRWSFNPTVDGHTDAEDTLLGQAANDAATQDARPGVVVNAKITATQVD